MIISIEDQVMTFAGLIVLSASRSCAGMFGARPPQSAPSTIVRSAGSGEWDERRRVVRTQSAVAPPSADLQGQVS